MAGICSCTPGRSNNHVIRLFGHIYSAVIRLVIRFWHFARFTETEAFYTFLPFLVTDFYCYYASIDS